VTLRTVTHSTHHSPLVSTPCVQDLGILHRAMLIYWNHVRLCSFQLAIVEPTCRSCKHTQGQRQPNVLQHMTLQWVSKAPTGRHGSDAFRSMLHKPRKTRDFHAAVQQVCSLQGPKQTAFSPHARQAAAWPDVYQL
jgi:hypothetical protein